VRQMITSIIAQLGFRRGRACSVSFHLSQFATTICLTMV
jgi:hypothetical protein